MGGSSVGKLALSVAQRASATMASATASPDEKTDAYSCTQGIRRRANLIRAASAHTLIGSSRRGLANLATARPARKFRTGLREVWSAVGGEVDADSTSWRAFFERNGFARDASGQGWDETFSQLREWLIPDVTDPSDVGWDFISDVLRNSERRQLTSKLRMSAASTGPTASDMERGELALAGLSLGGASEIADMIARSLVDDAQVGRASKDAAQSFGIEQDWVIQGRPRSKMARIADRAESLEKLWKSQRTSCAAACSASNR